MKVLDVLELIDKATCILTMLEITEEDYNKVQNNLMPRYNMYNKATLTVSIEFKIFGRLTEKQKQEKSKILEGMFEKALENQYEEYITRHKYIRKRKYERA